MSNPLSIIEQSRLVAILRLDDLSTAVELTRALVIGGLRAIEFTLTNPQALEALQAVLAEIPEFAAGTASVGIGSVRNVREASAAIGAGAQFIVSPITRADIIETCVEQRVPTFPGAFTPTEIAMAWDAGASAVKVFPANGLGPRYIRDVLAPMPYLKLMPTGGVDLENMPTYFKAGAIAVGMGSNLLDPEALRTHNWHLIAENARRYAQAAAKPL